MKKDAKKDDAIVVSKTCWEVALEYVLLTRTSLKVSLRQITKVGCRDESTRALSLL